MRVYFTLWDTCRLIFQTLQDLGRCYFYAYVWSHDQLEFLVAFIYYGCLSNMLIILFYRVAEYPLPPGANISQVQAGYFRLD